MTEGKGGQHVNEPGIGPLNELQRKLRNRDTLIKMKETHIKKLRDYVAKVLHYTWDGSEPDGAQLQDWALEAGFLVKKPIDPEDSEFGEDEQYFIIWEEAQESSIDKLEREEAQSGE